MCKLKGCTFGHYNTFYENSRISDSNFGDYVYVGPRTMMGNVSVGKFCSIGPDVRIGLGMHPTNFVSTFPAFFSRRGQCQISFCEKELFTELGKIIIGNDVWIGANVIVLDNVSIGDGAIIAAGAVVTKDVEPYAIVGGVPANLIRKRFSDTEISELLHFQWWNKDIEWIKQNYISFSSINSFFKKEL